MPERRPRKTQLDVGKPACQPVSQPNDTGYTRSISRGKELDAIQTGGPPVVAAVPDGLAIHAVDRQYPQVLQDTTNYLSGQRRFAIHLLRPRSSYSSALS